MLFVREENIWEKKWTEEKGKRTGGQNRRVRKGREREGSEKEEGTLNDFLARGPEI